LAALLAGCVCSVLTLPVVAFAQAEGKLPLHWAAIKGAGLEVVAALLQVHPQAAQVADKVKGAAWETVGLWMCVWERERVSACVD